MIIYALIVFVGWGVGAIRRRVDTQVFTRIYADLAVKVIMNEKVIKKDDLIIVVVYQESL
ncbi:MULTISPECIES: ABC transporter six-transmembrane domain-containing protein [unclassified Campylobacter]|uniref:ABC transporter six-transmembrane domain-containing protein n=1 Tax=unclassified Campylobacter TaxID=2593542 RepID=UPI003D331B3E